MKDLNEKREEYSEIYHIIVENAGEGIVIAQDEKILFVNRKMLEISGYSFKEVLSRPFLEFVYPEDRPQVMELYMQMIKGQEAPEHYQLRIIHKNGNPVWIETTTVPIIWKGKTATLNFIRDITEIKKAEEEKNKLQMQLIQSQKMEAIGRFVAGIVHDFNNILTAIKGFAELAHLKLPENDSLKKYFDSILFSVENAEKLVKYMLAFSRKHILKPEIINLNDLIKSMKEILKRLIGEDIILITNLSPDLGVVEADPLQMEQVILNLIVNAKDAMPRGGKFIIETKNIDLDESYIKKHEKLRKGQYVLISVTDTGIGIPEEIRDKIFEPFFTTKEGKRTGFGLSIVYEIVKKHGGDIVVHSELYKGTTFEIYLPRVDKDLQKKIEPEEEKILKGSETILVVDDDERICQLLVEMLKKLGYKVLEAKDYNTALFLAQFYDKKIDLVISDVVIPGINGPKLIKRIKNFRPDIKVLYMSGYPDEVVENYGIKKKEFNFIDKPFTMKSLSKKIRDVLSGIK